MDHDRLFKELLRTFFSDFLQLFAPEVADYVEPESLEFLDKELFSDLLAGDRHEVDLLVKGRFRGQATFFLIHVETQSSTQEEFAARMFRYFARLHEKFGLPVYPIALFTYDSPLRPERDNYEVVFPDLAVLAFKFRTVQLNRLNWRDFVRLPNPIAAALMAKMRIAPEDRPRVKLECLRLLATLRLDKARQGLIRDFMDSYLRLSAEEMRVYNQELATIQPSDREAVMQIVNEWEALGEARGEARGETRGQSNVLIRLLSQRFGHLPADIEQQIRGLPKPKLDALTDIVLQFSNVEDVQGWVALNG